MSKIDYFSNFENLKDELKLYAVQSQGPNPIVPLKQSRDGVLNAIGTLEMIIYAGFPRKQVWLDHIAAANAAQNLEDINL